MVDEPVPEDVVELGRRRPLLPGWPPSRGAAGLAAAALAVGLAAGYVAGDRHGLARSGKAAAPAASPAPVTAPAPATSPAPVTGAIFSFVASPGLSQGTTTCATQTGQEIQLGVQVTNQFTVPVLLRAVRSVLPLGGLKQVSWQWNPCGTLPGLPEQADEVLGAGASTWLTATFKVQVHCPAASPVQFTVGYLVQGRSRTVRLPGFADLGQVAYSGCPA